MTDPATSAARQAAARYTPQPCGRTARGTKYGSSYVLVCQQQLGHHGQHRDIDNDTWFIADEEATP
ncbi:hypothetical protein ACFRNT_14305 [Streptomyces sp. NPDC056697]|uniref:hypothetical protein n=1 Tax=Streptomyces sp. NPDC056697 TaxID=3345915 RepID=UPI0036A08263